MGKDRNGAHSEKRDAEEEVKDRKHRRKARENSESELEEERKHSKSRRKAREDSESEVEEDRKRRKSRSKSRDNADSDSEEDGKPSRKEKRKRKSRKRYSSSEESDSDDSGSEYSDSVSESETESSGSEVSESEEDRRRRKKRRERRRREREEEKLRERKRIEKKRKRKDREEEKRKKSKKKKKKEKKKKEKEKGKKGAVTDSWGKYGIIRETDMWNKRPEFTAWLAEVKQVNLESLANWEEKNMFKEFMEDHNTATFPSKKYYNLDAYHRHKMEKQLKKGMKMVQQKERTVFNDEEQRRQELMREREKQKEEQVEALKSSMQGGMAQAMKEQALLREEMALQYKLGNNEAAAAIQRRLDPDVAMELRHRRLLMFIWRWRINSLALQVYLHEYWK